MPEITKLLDISRLTREMQNGLTQIMNNTLCNHDGKNPDNKVHGASMGPTRVLSAPGGLHVGPMNLAQGS